MFLGTAFQNIKDIDFYPCIGFKSPNEKIRGNFGSQPFQFDICQYLNDEKHNLLESISFIPIKSGTTSSIVNSALASNTADKVVLEYLRHNGYDKAAKALKDSLISKESGLSNDSDLQEEDLDLQRRKG